MSIGINTVYLFMANKKQTKKEKPNPNHKEDFLKVLTKAVEPKKK